MSEEEHRHHRNSDDRGHRHSEATEDALRHGHRSPLGSKEDTELREGGEVESRRHHVEGRSSAPEIAKYHHRYFENPYSDSSAQPLHESGSRYADDALSLLRKIHHHYSGASLSEVDEDIYTELAGVAYACYRAVQKPINESEKQMALGLGIRLIDAARENRHHNEHGFLVGSAGVFVVGALMYKAAGDDHKSDRCLETFAQYCDRIDSLKPHKSSGDEMFSGRSGFLAGYLELWKAFPNHETLKNVDVRKIVERILRSGQDYSKKEGLENECPLYFYHFDAPYLGAAHGISSILHILLQFPGVLGRIDGAANLIKRSVDYVLEQQSRHGNFPPQFGEKADDHDELVHWCHGAAAFCGVQSLDVWTSLSTVFRAILGIEGSFSIRATGFRAVCPRLKSANVLDSSVHDLGVIYMLGRAYLTWRDQKYLDAMEACASIIWKKGLLRKGPSICHGISGNGYAFLLMYRITGQAEYLYRAQCFADIMFHEKIQEKSRTPDNPFSLFEGVAGSVCFLADMADPKEAAFPFCDIFIDCPVGSGHRHHHSRTEV